MRSGVRALFLAAGLLAWAALWAGEAAAPRTAVLGEAELGIEVVRVTLSASGNIVDLRYRVLDPERAKGLLTKGAKVLLKDEASGKLLAVPSLGYVGSLQQNSPDPQKGRVYYVLFNNVGQLVKPGRKVTLILGDRRVTGLTVI